jgi:hypothetical protein
MAFAILHCTASLIYGQNKEPTSGLKPLTPAPVTSANSGVAGVYKFRISRRSFVPSVAHYCRALHPG